MGGDCFFMVFEYWYLVGLVILLLLVVRILLVMDECEVIELMRDILISG